MRTADRLTEAAAELVRRYPGLDPARAYRLALAADRDLARLHHAGEAGEALVAPAATTIVAPRMAPGFDPMHPRLRHYSELTAAERARALPRLRQLRPGEQRPAGAIGVEKFGGADIGGGSFVVELR